MNSVVKPFRNPFKPGAGHMPPYLAGRESEFTEYDRLIDQETILENLIITGLRGVGKTVLLESFKPIAIENDWLWVGTDLSESSSLSEKRITIRLLTDLSIVTSSMVISTHDFRSIGFNSETVTTPLTLNYQTLIDLFEQTPGLVSDKLKHVLEIVWSHLQTLGKKGIIFAYDEAQNLMDASTRDEYPLSVLLDVFQSIQRMDIPFMLILTGLPTLFPKLVESRTYSERMFRVVFLDKLNRDASKDAIVKPIQKAKCPVSFSDESVERIVEVSGGYPYFIQFICREVYDVFIQQIGRDEKASVPVEEITKKLDSDFFAGRWGRATDRQRELLIVIAKLETSGPEFSVQDIVGKSKDTLERPFSASHVNQMLSTLSNAGLIYKNRRGKYSFAVPLLGDFIKRQL